MTSHQASQLPVRHPLGIASGVNFDVVAWGPAMADVDFSVACMFEQIGRAHV